jgi:heme oxygenase
MLLTMLGQTKPTGSVNSETRMQQLRQATQSAHARIERAIPLLDPGLSRTGYIRLLQAFYGFYAPMEPLCVDAAGDFGTALDLASRAKAPLLVDDLGVLGHSLSDTRTLARCRALPTVKSPSQAMGALYVLEGAPLGGQIIRRHLQCTMGIDGASGAAFFVGYGDRTGEMWKVFAGHVNRVDCLDIDGAVSAAIETFETLERWMIASLAST